MPDQPLVDVHSHFLPDWYVEAAIAAGHTVPDAMPAWPTWNVDDHLRLMDSNNIDQAVLSISSPGIHFGDDTAARDLARRVNDFAGRVCAARPDRFRFFAALPLPDVEGAVAELVRGLDDLGASGVAVETNAGGRYLNDPAYEQVWQALNDRAAAVFVHPTSPLGWESTSFGLPRPLIEFLFDTTRTIFGLVVSGALTRHPGMQVIVPHCGAAIPALMDRATMFEDGLRAMFADDHPIQAEPRVADIVASLWFDLAGTPLPTQAPLLASKVGTDRLLYGSDFCFTPSAMVDRQVASLDEGWAAVDDQPWRELTANNAARLFAAT